MASIGADSSKFLYTLANPRRVMASKDPPSRIISGKPKEWCSCIKTPQNALYFEFNIISIFNEIKNSYTLYGVAPTTLLQFTPFKFEYLINLA